MIRSVMRTIGIPTTARELGFERETMIQALVEARNIRPERYTILRDGLKRHEAEEALVAVGMIE